MSKNGMYQEHNHLEDKTNGAGRSRPRRLLLCLDGVPYDMMLAAKERGLFDAFGAPSRLLSPFPTMTNIALSTMLGATPPLGYECLYFDRRTQDLRGGIGKYIGRRTPDKVPSSYMDELDYQEPLPFEFLIYVAPEAVWRADMKRFRERFRHAPQTRDYFAFLKGTDGLLHIRGPKRLEVALQSLDQLLKEIQAWCGTETEIVLFSDHGMSVRENRRVNLQTHLSRCGYKFANNLHGPDRRRRLVVPAFGLIGYAAMFCADDEVASNVAESLVPLEGVDFSIYRDGENGIMVQGERGLARIERHENGRGPLFRYQQLTGDPLQLAPIVSALQQEGQLDQQGYAADRAWYEQTAAHLYPDALANLYNALHSERVSHSADVLVSLQDGYYYGMSAFEYIVRLAATHGNASRASTSAFLMSTHRDFAPSVRGSEARPLLKGW